MTKPKDRSVSLLAANLLAPVMALPPIALLLILYIKVWGYEGVFGWLQTLSGPRALAAVAALLVSVPVHELIHGVSYAIFGRKPLATVRLRFELKALAPYVHLEERIGVRPYRLAILMPALILGLLPSLAGLLTGSAWALAFGLSSILAAGGDMVILWVLRGVAPGSLVEDHPTRAGCYVIEIGGGPG